MYTQYRKLKSGILFCLCSIFMMVASSEVTRAMTPREVLSLQDSVRLYYNTANQTQFEHATSLLTIEAKHSKNADLRYWTNYFKLLYEVRYGDRTGARLDILNYENELKTSPNNLGYSCLNLLLGHFYFYRTDYDLAIEYLSKVKDTAPASIEGNKVCGVANALIAKCQYGNFRCYEAMEVSAEARKFDLDIYRESDCIMVDCLSAGFLEDKEKFLKSYEQFKVNSSDINVADSLYIEAYNDFFTKGSVDLSYYNARLVKVKGLKLSYLISRISKDYESALKFNENFRITQNSAHSRQFRGDVDVISVEVAKQELRASYSTRVSKMVLLFTFIIIITFFIFVYILRNKNKAIIKANQEKIDAVQNMAHDVRTPLNAVVGFSQLLSLPDGCLTDEERENYAQFVTTNSQLLNFLIDDVLAIHDKSKAMQVKIQDGCNANFLGKQAVLTCEHRCRPGVEMRFESELKDDFTFRSDPNRVLQVLINFLSNATKNTENGSIILAASLTENPGYLTYSVTDTGIGIPIEKQDEIFKRFVKIDENKQGSGLGLNICTQIAEKLSGRVSLDKAYTNGARFVFVLPVE